jgi:sugar phosphate isomerase/epimerase
MSQESKNNHSTESAPGNSHEKKVGDAEKELIPQSKRESKHTNFSEKKETLEKSIGDTEKSPVFEIDLESKKIETDQKIQELEQGLGGLSEESKQQIIENNVGRLGEQRKQAEEKVRELTEQRAELIKQRLLENWGISFSSREKDKTPLSIEEQLAIAKVLEIKELQIDLRNRSEIDLIREKLSEFQKESPSTNTSLHGETPHIDEATLGIKNIEKLNQEIQLAIESGSDIYTVHPPHISREIFSNLTPEQQKTIIGNYSAFFAESIKKAVDSQKSLVVAIENIPAKGESGGFGQNPEEIKLMIDNVVEILEKQHNLDPQEAERFVGVTLDINHALTEAEPSKREEIMRKWFDNLGGKIKAFHIYSPSSTGLEFDQKLSQFLRLYKEYGLDAPIYLESKQKPEATKEVFLSGRENSEIQMKEKHAEEKEIGVEKETDKEKETIKLLDAIKSIYRQARSIKEKVDISQQNEQMHLLIQNNEIISEYFDEGDKELLTVKALQSNQESTENILSDLQEIVPKIRKRIDNKFEE